MSYLLKLEAIGDDERAYLEWCRNQIDDAFGINGLGQQIQGRNPARYWVAEITGLDPQFKYRRRFIKGKKDYSESNSVGSRGVYIYYILNDGKIYEVSKPVSWKKADRYFCTIVNGGLVKLTEEEVKNIEWVKDS